MRVLVADLSPFGGLVRLSHRSKANDVNTTIEKAHQSADHG